MCRLVSQIHKAGVDNRFRLHIASVIRFLLVAAAPHLRQHLFRIQYRIMLQLRETPRKAFQILLLPLLALHEHRVTLTLHLQQRPQRVQPTGIQTGRPQRLLLLGKRLPQPGHILRIARILRSTVLLQDPQSQIAAKRRRYVQYIRQHTLIPVPVLPDFTEDQLLHDRSVDGETLSHKSEPQDLIVLPFPDRHGIDLRRCKGSRYLMKTRKRICIPGQVFHLHTVAVNFCDHRLIVAHAQVVTGSCKKACHGVDRFPKPIGLLIIRERLRDQKRASVKFLIALFKVNAPIPHHRLKIPLQLIVPFIISTGYILGIILHLPRDLRLTDHIGPPDAVKFILRQIGRLFIYDSAVIQKFHSHIEKGNIAFCRTFPLAAF